MELYGTIGTQTYSNLLADPQGAETISVPIEPGNGAVTRGTLLYRKATGLYAPAAAAQAIDTNMLAVLNENIDTGSAPGSGEKAVAMDAPAYRSGRFVDGAVTLAAGATLTAAIKVTLRKQNIVFDKDDSVASFTNEVTGS